MYIYIYLFIRHVYSNRYYWGKKHITNIQLSWSQLGVSAASLSFRWMTSNKCKSVSTQKTNKRAIQIKDKVQNKSIQDTSKQRNGAIREGTLQADNVTATDWFFFLSRSQNREMNSSENRLSVKIKDGIEP